MRIKEVLFLLAYSAKSMFWGEPLEFISSLKKPRTWSYLLYATFLLSLWYRWFTIMLFTLPCIGIVYLITQHNDPDYHVALKRHAFIMNDRVIVRKEHEKYLRACRFNNKPALSYDEFRREELRKMNQV